MKTPPEGLTEAELQAALVEGWGFDAVSVEYLPVGFGSYHWLAVDRSGERRFVTVDDLFKARAGVNAGVVFAGLRRAFDTARALEDEANLPFVVAPVCDADGEVIRRVGLHHSVAVFPFVEGVGGDWEDEQTDGQRVAVAGLLARLHGASSLVGGRAGREDFLLPCRTGLMEALAELGSRWDTGPYAEPARAALGENAERVVVLLAEYERLATLVARDEDRFVITHGEPHPANVMTTASGLVLIDWDTTLVGPPERDLWMIVDDDGLVSAAYTEMTGTEVHEDGLVLYRLWWDLSEIAEYVSQFRRAHGPTDDTAEAWKNFSHYIDLEAHWASLL